MICVLKDSEMILPVQKVWILSDSETKDKNKHMQNMNK